MFDEKISRAKLVMQNCKLERQNQFLKIALAVTIISSAVILTIIALINI